MSFASPRRAPVLSVFPLASMIDIIFLVLVFFLTISSFREQERQIDVSLPATETAADASRSRTQVVITVMADGQIFLGDQLHSLESLKTTLAQLQRQFPDESVVIRGDRSSRLGLAVQVMDAAYASGLRNVFLATSKQASEIGG